MTLVSHYRLQLLLAWLALEATARAQGASRSVRSVPSVVTLLGRAHTMQQRLQPWLVALLTQRRHLAWALHPPGQRRPQAAQLQEHLLLEAFDLGELCRWHTGWLHYLLEAELARLVWLLEAPCALMSRPGWDRWEVARWSLAGCLARISQLEGVLAQQQAAVSARTGLNAALAVVWQRLTAQAQPRRA